MTGIRAVIVTAVSCFACACGSSEGTSLDGPTACEATQCTSGQLCRYQAEGIDAGVPNPPSCVDVPAGCSVFDCTGHACSSCVLDLCADQNLADYVHLMGRRLDCPAQ